jgi:hypothetical protein
MRFRFLGSLVLALLAAYGCGGGASKSDARPSDGASESRPDSSSDTRKDVGTTDATTYRRDAAPDVAGDGGGADGSAPTCTDGVKNGDETGTDCGGHCSKCGPGLGCLTAVDCQFAICKPDMTCGACNVAADCAGIETECQMRACTAGVCGSVLIAAGTVLAVQTSGDCKHRQCDGTGAVVTVNDDTDVPNDENPCTNDRCSGGNASHTNVSADTNCGGVDVCNGNGQCVGCTAASDCPGTDTPCRNRTCSAQGVCGVTLKAAGTKLTDPAAGDCRGLSCDGAGNSQINNDDTDLPVDNNPCTTDVCNAGTASHQAIASGASCGGTSVCDGASHCVACVSASACPGTNTACRTRTCIANVCGISNAAAGTALALQTAKDCKKSQCDGNGGTQTVADETDLPVDNNPCTADVCTAGTPSNPFVTAGTICGGGSMVCNGQGTCVGCVTASNCPGTDSECHTRTCVASTCGVTNKAAGTLLSSQIAGDCKKQQCDGNGGIQTVADNTDLPGDNNPCTTDVCTSGAPSNPPVASGTSCGTGQLCNGSGACVRCLTASDCPGTDATCRTRTCVGGQCGATNAPAGTPLPTQIAGDCQKEACDGAGTVVTVADNTDLPVDGNQCTMDVCTNGTPSNPAQPSTTTCGQNGGTHCNGSSTAPACVQCLQAADCSGTDTECHARSCTAGVCGVSNIAAGTPLIAQTAGDCQKKVCDGSGAIAIVSDNTDLPVDGNECTADVCTNGMPSNPAQPSTATCGQGGGTHCNGSSTAPACVP